MTRYCIDIDGTLCTNTWGEYERAEPRQAMIDWVRRLHAAGHEIVLFTARGSTTGVDWRDLTTRQIAAWGVPFHDLRFGKPEADVYVDDRAVVAGDGHAIPDAVLPATVASFRPSLWEALGPDEYFVRRDTGLTSTDTEADFYWREAVDPDGRVRRPAQEGEAKRAQAATELAYINALPPGHLLDVGCGPGHLLAGVDAAWQKHGVEVNAYAADLAAAVGAIHVGGLANAGYAEASFDVVLLYHVIEHVREPVALVADIFRLLKPGGHFIVGTPDFDCAMARRYGPRYRMLHDQTHISLFSDDSLQRLLRDQGFQVLGTHRPFFDTPYFTVRNLQALFDTDQVSPPFYGNLMTKFCRRP